MCFRSFLSLPYPLLETTWWQHYFLLLDVQSDGLDFSCLCRSIWGNAVLSSFPHCDIRRNGSLPKIFGGMGFSLDYTTEPSIVISWHILLNVMMELCHSQHCMHLYRIKLRNIVTTLCFEFSSLVTMILLTY